jgi:ubiquinone/menaquinone biosynthesis C-methylase UbiE
MSSRFTEQDTELYYDAQDVIYRSIWDKDGSVHWGVFDRNTGEDFLKGCANLNNIMAEKARIDANSRVLDLGCGSGTTAMWLAQDRNCRVTGVDLSGVRIQNAKDTLQTQPQEMRQNVDFEKASAIELPFPDGSFTHVWSQAVIYHIHDKEETLKEAYRVLADGGIFIFDDLVKPKQDISESAKTYVYDRLLFDTPFSFKSYGDALRQAGFKVLNSQDLSIHLKKSYSLLSDMASAKTDGPTDKYQALALAYEKTAQAIEDGELGWGLYLCQK